MPSFYLANTCEIYFKKRPLINNTENIFGWFIKSQQPSK